MNNLMKILFSIAVAIFIAGVIWALTTTVRVVKNRQETPKTSITTQTSTPPPAAQPALQPATPTPAPVATSQPAARTVRPARRPVVRKTIVQPAPMTTTSDFSASAWARAGANADGSTFAETGVN